MTFKNNKYTLYMSKETENVVQMLTDRFGKEKWFIKADTYGYMRVIIYFRNTNKSWDSILWKLRNVTCRRFADCEVTWRKVP